MQDAREASNDIEVAVAISPTKTSSAGNAALLRANSDAFRSSFELFDSGVMPTSQFRGHLRGMGIVETSEAFRLLSTPGAATYTALVKALASGTDVPDRPLGKSSDAFHPVQNTALHSNVLQHGPPAAKAREVRTSLYATSPLTTAAVGGGGTHNTGVHGRAYGPYGGQDTDVPATSPFSEHRYKAREVRRDAYVDSGAASLLRGDAALPHARTDQARLRARNLMAQLEAGAMDGRQFMDRLCEAMGEAAGSFPAEPLPRDMEQFATAFVHTAVHGRGGQIDYKPLLGAVDEYLHQVDPALPSSPARGHGIAVSPAAMAQQVGHSGLLSWGQQDMMSMPASPAPLDAHGAWSTSGNGQGTGALSGRAVHPSKVASVWSESTPDTRDSILPHGVAARAAQAGMDPRHMIQRVKLHPSRSHRADAPFAYDT